MFPQKIWENLELEKQEMAKRAQKENSWKEKMVSAKRPVTPPFWLDFLNCQSSNSAMSMSMEESMLNTNMLCSGATAHSQNTALGTSVALTLIDNKALAKESTIARAEHMSSLDKLLPQKLVQSTVRVLPDGLIDYAAYGGRTMKIANEDRSQPESDAVTSPPALNGTLFQYVETGPVWGFSFDELAGDLSSCFLTRVFVYWKDRTA